MAFDPAALELLMAGINDIQVDTEGVEKYTPEDAAKRYHSLSYSSLNLLHDCPRKFQLYRLIPRASRESSIHLTYGSVVGIGMQMLFAGASMEEVILEMFMKWDLDLDFSDNKARKSFWFAIDAVQRFQIARECTDLVNWEPVVLDGKPAAELGFRIVVGEYYYRGFIDLVIRNKHTGEIAVLECKTTGANYLNPASYGNSSQGLSYSLPLDQLFPDLSSYTVYYLVYMTATNSWEILPFEKHLHQRSKFIRDLICDVRTIEMYKEVGFPERGSACVSFNRTCTFYGSCGMETSELVPYMEAYADDADKYQFTFNLEDIIERQEEHVHEIL